MRVKQSQVQLEILSPNMTYRSVHAFLQIDAIFSYHQ